MANQRGKVYVDRLVQGALAKRILVHWCLFFLLALLSLFSLEFFLGDPNLSVAGKLGLLWNKYAFFIILMVFTMPTFIYDTLKLSNRFVGPVLRLRNSIHSLANGDQVPELHFRENDFWSELSEDFNRVAKRVQETPARQETELQEVVV